MKKPVHLIFVLLTVLMVVPHTIYPQQKLVSTTYYQGTKVKKVEYEYVSGKAGTAGNIQIRDDKTKLLKSVDQNSYSINSMTPHGYWKEYYANGTMSKSLNYVYGVKQGPAKEYYETGVLKNQYNFTNNIIDGEFSWFYENGKLDEKCVYVNGRRTGMSSEFDENGKPYISLFYNEHEARDGSPVSLSYKMKHDNGKTLEEGLLTSTYSQDRFPFSFYYDDFKRQGVFKSYDENGVKTMEANYKDNTATNSTSFYPSGNKKEEKSYLLYKNNDKYYLLVDGPYKEYYENGQLAKSGIMKTWGSPSKSDPNEIEKEEYKAGDWKEYDQTGKFVHFTSYGEKDQVLLEMDQKAVEEQGNISEALDFNAYKSRSIDKFGKYFRYHYGEMLINFASIDKYSGKNVFDDIKSKAMKVYDEFNSALASCTTKACVNTQTIKLDKIFQKLEELRLKEAKSNDTDVFVNFSMQIDQYGIKTALGVN